MSTPLASVAMAGGMALALVASGAGAAPRSTPKVPFISGDYMHARPKLLALGFQPLVDISRVADPDLCRNWTADARCRWDSLPEGFCAADVGACVAYWLSPRDGRYLRIGTRGEPEPGVITSRTWTIAGKEGGELEKRMPIAVKPGRPAPTSGARDCLGELRAPLVKAGFYYGDCADLRIKIRFLGRTTGPHPYRLYNWEYEDRGGAAIHGGERILLFDDSLNYIGQYMMGGAFHPRLEGAVLHFDAPAKMGNVLRLDGAHPPWVAVIGGDEVEFFK